MGRESTWRRPYGVGESRGCGFYDKTEAKIDNEHDNWRFDVNRRLRKALKGLTENDLEQRRRTMDAFVRATFEGFSRCLYRYLGNEVECEDVLQSVYADIWEKPERLRNVNSERELLRTVYMYYMRKRLREVYRRINRNLNLSQEGLKRIVAPEIDIPLCWGIFHGLGPVSGGSRVFSPKTANPPGVRGLERRCCRHDRY